MSKELSQLISVGQATLKDFETLGIKTLAALAKCEARDLYFRLCRKTKVMHDPCAEDVFAAAIAQARNSDLSEHEKKWSYYSSQRKARKVRCGWVPTNNPLYEHYHDTEWGVPVHDDRRHFEFLILEGAQAGLSWETVLKRRSAYREAFADFDYEKVKDFEEASVDDLLKAPIIRNRSKIKSVIQNAKCFCQVRKEFGSFDAYIWQFTNGKVIQGNRKNILELPVSSPESTALSKDLQKRGFTFVGPTIIYAHMQACGLVNDHTTDCFCHTT